MRRAFGASALLHALGLLALLPLARALPVAPAELEARIEVIFGHAAEVGGAAAPADAAAAEPAVPRDTPPPADGAEATPPPSPPAAGPPTTFAPVRLGEARVGFDVKRRDSGLVEAVLDPGNRPPAYPPGAQARREQGTAVLGIHVGADGRVATIDLLRSSGHAALDDAARAAALRWRFLPRLQDGVAVPSYREQAIAFVL